MAGWHPRGEPTWPNWRNAEHGVTRVEHVRTGRRGTFARWSTIHGRRNPGYATIDWDNGARGRVVAYAFDLREVDE